MPLGEVVYEYYLLVNEWALYCYLKKHAFLVIDEYFLFQLHYLLLKLIQLQLMTEWQYNSTSGYYYNQSNGFYYDANSGFYYSDAIGIDSLHFYFNYCVGLIILSEYTL